MSLPAPAGWGGVVLAGGRSTRMGRDKALLPWGDGTLLEHMARLLRAAGADEVVVSGDRPAMEGIVDAVADTGPMGALAQLCPRLDDGRWVVVPVDMPLLSRALLQALAANPSSCTCVAGHPLPMGLQLDAATRAVIAGIGAAVGPARSFRALQQQLQASELAAAGWEAQLRNCNTLEEWQALRHSSR